jgi:hypothetical protein
MLWKLERAIEDASLLSVGPQITNRYDWCTLTILSWKSPGRTYSTTACGVEPSATGAYCSIPVKHNINTICYPLFKKLLLSRISIKIQFVIICNIFSTISKLFSTMPKPNPLFSRISGNH